MYSKILVPLDPGLGDEGHQALKAARALLEPGGQIEVLTVFQPLPPYYGAVVDAGHFGEQQKRTQAVLTEKFGAPDVTIRGRTGHITRVILEAAGEGGHDCIVIASRQPGWSHVLLGSTAAGVVRHARCSVHVLRAAESESESVA